MSKNLEEGEKALPGRDYIPGRFASRMAATAALVLLVLCAAPRARAQSPADGDTAADYELPPVTVVAEPVLSERQAENPSKFVTVIETGEASQRVETAGEALSETAGVQVKSMGGMAGPSSVSIRGSSASQVEVYLDGLPLNRAATGFADVSDIPLDFIERIEVFRGFAPADLSAAGIGGAVNLVTRQDLESRIVLTGSYGTYDTYKATAAAAAPAGRLRLIFYGGYGSSRGDFEYENDNGTPLRSDDDFTDRRVNNDYQSGDLAVRASADAGAWSLAQSVTWHYKDQGLPGLMSSQAEHTRLRLNRGTASFSARNPELAGGEVDLSLGADGLIESQVLDDPEGELGTGGERRIDNRTHSAGARGRAVWHAADGFALAFYTEYRNESYQPVDLIEDEEGKTQSRDQLALALQAELRDPSDIALLQLAVRDDLYRSRLHGDPAFDVGRDREQDLDLISPSAGLRIRLTDTLAFKANGGRFYRVPTFYELFGDRGTAMGNPGLKPEEGVNFDVGFSWHGDDIGPIERPFIEYAYFESRMTDLILFFQNSQRTITAVNIGGAWIGGDEVAFGFDLLSDFHFTGNYTFQSAIDEGEIPYLQGNALPFRPMHEGYLRVGWTPAAAVETWAEGSWMSGNYWDRANLYEVPPREIYNVGLTWNLPSRPNAGVYSVTVEGKNLGDDRIADIAGYPLPGRSAFVTVQGRW